MNVALTSHWVFFRLACRAQIHGPGIAGIGCVSHSSSSQFQLQAVRYGASCTMAFHQEAKSCVAAALQAGILTHLRGEEAYKAVMLEACYHHVS